MGRDADTHVRVTEEVWSELNKKKRPGDSFNDVIERLLDEQEDREEGNDDTVARSSGGEVVCAD